MGLEILNQLFDEARVGDIGDRSAMLVGGHQAGSRHVGEMKGQCVGGDLQLPRKLARNCPFSPILNEKLKHLESGFLREGREGLRGLM